MSGYTFDGRLEEFPDICVDRFNLPGEIYLLTHSHKDHLVGLNNKSFSSSVYCTEVTKNILSLDSTYTKVLPFLKAVPYNTPITRKCNGKMITLTLIPSYHCPGSCMFLIEGSQQSVLITGDIRAESWWVELCKKNVYLLPYIYGSLVLDNIYLDTTFGYRGEPFIEIPYNTDGIMTTMKFLKLYPQDDPDIQMFFQDLVLGFEEAWGSIVNAFRGQLHTSDYISDRNALFTSNNYIVPYGELLATSDVSGVKFHACGNFCSQEPKFKVHIRQRIDFNIIDLLSNFSPIDIGTLDFKERLAIKVLDRTSKGFEVCQYQDRCWLKVNNKLLSNEVKLVFSRHSSYTESKNFVRLFKPRQVYPCTVTDDLWRNGFSMARLFGLVCQLGDPSEYTFDRHMSCKWGYPPSHIWKRPIKTINRWNIKECQRELEFVEKCIKSSPEFDFRGINFDSFNNESPERHQLVDAIEEVQRSDIQKLIERTSAIYTKYLQLRYPGLRPIRTDYLEEIQRLEKEYYTNSMSSSGENYSSISYKVDSVCVTASRTPTLQDEIIKSSFTSVEESFKRSFTGAGLDEATVNMIKKRLINDPDKYFELTLNSIK